MGQQNSKIKQAVSNVDFVPIIKIFRGLFEQYAEEDNEENGCQDTILFLTIGDR